MQKCLILDIDGVLLLNNSFPKDFNKNLLTELIKKFGKQLDLGKIPLQDMLDEYNNTEHTNLTADSYLKKLYKHIILNKELVKFCTQNHKRLTILLLSNNFRENVAYLEAKFPVLKKMASARIYSYDTQLTKPNSDMFHYALRKINIRADRCFFVDDSLKNVNAARKLGINALHFQGHNDNVIKGIEKFLDTSANSNDSSPESNSSKQ